MVLIIGLIIILGVVGYSMLKPNSGAYVIGAPLEGQGQVIVSVKDASVDMATISEISMTVNRAELHSIANGWTTVSAETKVFNLLDLKARDESALLTAINLAAGTYDQIRVTIGSIKVTTKDGVVSDAKLPSGQLQMSGNIVVTAGEVVSVNLDFLASASIHKTGTGLFVFAPVVHMEVRGNADVKISSNDGDKNIPETVEIKDGEVKAEVDAGMDINGEMKNNFELKDDVKIKIDNGIIKLED